jgi:ligand-binding SRPBCC domain-containing protein
VNNPIFRFHAQQFVPYPLELVFAFFANPQNLPHLMPKWQATRFTQMRLVPPPPRPLAHDPRLRFQSVAAGKGSELDIAFRPVPLIPVSIGWQGTITEFEWNSHFCDQQQRGPFATWRHCHRFLSAKELDPHGNQIPGTHVIDELEYSVPLGPLSPLANQLFLQPQMNYLFHHRQNRLNEILPKAAKQAGL